MPLAESQGSDGWEGLKEVKSQGAELHWQIKKKRREEKRREEKRREEKIIEEKRREEKREEEKEEKEEKKRKKDRNMILVFNHMV